MGQPAHHFMVNSSGGKAKPTLHFFQDTPAAGALSGVPGNIASANLDILRTQNYTSSFKASSKR